MRRLDDLIQQRQPANDSLAIHSPEFTMNALLVWGFLLVGFLSACVGRWELRRS